MPSCLSLRPAGHSGPVHRAAQLLTTPLPRGQALPGDRALAKAHIRPRPTRAKAQPGWGLGVASALTPSGEQHQSRLPAGDPEAQRDRTREPVSHHGRDETHPVTPVYMCNTPLPLRTQLPPEACPSSQEFNLNPPALQRPQGSRQSEHRHSELRGPLSGEAILLPVIIIIPSERDRRSREVQPPAEQLRKGGRDPHL